MSNNLGRAEAHERAGLLSVVSYDITVDFRADGETFRSCTVVRFDCAEPGSCTWIDLTGTLLSGSLNGQPVGQHDGNRIELADLANENELVVEAECDYMNTGIGVHRFVDPVDGATYLYTQFEAFDAHRMYACFDQPDLKAVFRVTALAPEEWVVVSNGETVLSEAGVWRFAETPVMSTYITALVAGPLAHVHDTHEGIALGLYCRRSLFEHLDSEALFSLTKKGFDFYHREFDMSYPFGKYDQIFVAEMAHNAMENAGAVTISEDLIFRSKVTEAEYENRAMVVLHEMAHMWFGNLVTMRWWDDLWLNESFATFVSFLCLADATEFTEAWTTFAVLAKGMAYEQDQLPAAHPIAADIGDVKAVEVNFDAITYAKGASVLKQLVAWVGHDMFMAGMRVYFRRHAWGNTSLADLLSCLETASGRDLTSWSAEWLETSGVNTVRPRLETDDAGVIIRFAIEQHGSPLRSHRIAVGFYDLVDGALVRTHRHELDVIGEKTTVPELIGVRRPAIVLLNDDDLAYVTVRFDPESLTTLIAQIGNLRGSLARTLCWSAAWDMTRDAEMAARDFVTLVQRGASSEQDVGMLRTLLQQAGTALALYADPEYAATAAEALSELARSELAASQPGSDRQLVWAHAAIGLSSAPALRPLLDGIPGLVMDQDLRWRLVERLVALGAFTDDEIDREATADTTDEGRRRALSCRAGVPTAAAKEQAWARIVDARELSQVDQAALVAGFQNADQGALLEPFVERFFACVGDLWSSREPALAVKLADGLYPRFVVKESVVERTDAYLANEEVPAPLARLLVEGRDNLRRALVARAVDAARGVTGG